MEPRNFPESANADLRRDQVSRQLCTHELVTAQHPVLRGWINYYGSFYKDELKSVLRHFNHKLLLWAQHEHGKLRSRRTRARPWLARVVARLPALFAHWAAFPAEFGR